MNNTVSIFDTSYSTLNVGDEIIMDSVNRELSEIFTNNEIFFRVSSHAGFGRGARKVVSRSKEKIIGGTNLLTSDQRLIRGNQWEIKYKDIRAINDVTLMGVGWQQYQKEITGTTKYIYNNILSKHKYHSVRDNYTKGKLEELGFKNILNTGCPTIWRLNSKLCESITTEKSRNVITTITDYRSDSVLDEKMLKTLKSEYENVYLWIQGSGDLDYFNTFSKDIRNNITLIPPRLRDYDDYLEKIESLDFVGTRLHAGIRAMQKGKRSLIVSVDNRATEMGKDFNLNVMERTDIDSLRANINSQIKTDVKLPIEDIKLWKSQFKN